MSAPWDDVADMEDIRWVSLAEAADAAGVSRSTLRSWYRSGQVESRMVPGPNGPQREVPLDEVLERARLSDRLGRGAALAVTEAAAPPAAGDHRTCLAAIAALEAALRRAEERADRAEAALRDLLSRRAEGTGTGRS